MLDLNYVSLFSGIEAFSVAASRVEGVRWHPVFFSEIEPFPCAVLAHHFPAVPNLGDICNIRVDREKGNITNGTATIPLPGTGIDILAGGSPCQDVSVAGKRAGMSEGSGTRSSLAFEYSRLVEELRPRVVLWENVHGVLSSNGGRDFLAFQRSLVERGYSLAWRVLDAQYARVDGYPLAVPQRRRRVWLVGCLGTDESVPAQILFERPCLLGDTPPRREAGKGFAAPSGYRSSGHDRVVECAGGSGSDVSEVLTARSFKGIGARNGQISGPFVSLAESAPSGCLTPGHPQRSGQDQRAVLVESASFDGADVSATLHKPNGTPGYSDQEIFAQQGAYLARVATFENHGQDSRVKQIDVSDTRSRKDGTGGNNLPLVVSMPVAFAQNQREEVRDLGDASETLPAEDGSHQRTLVAAPATFGKTGHAVNAEGEDEKYSPVDVAQTLNTFQNQSDARAVELVVAPSVCKTLSAEGFDGMPDIQKGNGMPVVAVRTAQTGANGCGISAEAAHTIDLASGHAVAIGFCPEESAKARSIGAHDETSPTLNSSSIRATAIGFKPGQSGREDTGSLGARMEESPTIPRDPGGMGVGVAIGFSHVASGAMLDCQPKPCAVPLKRSPGGDGAMVVGIDQYNAAISDSATTLGVNCGISTGRNGVATMLKVRCGKDTYIKPDGSVGTAGKGPLTISATQDKTLIQQVNTILEDNHANATKTNPGEILRVLREALGEKAFEEWTAGIAAPLWTKEVLRLGVHEESHAPTQGCGSILGVTQTSEESCSGGVLRDVRQAECDGCSPQGRGLPQQCAGEPDSPVPQLSHQGSPQAEGVQDLWRTDEGTRVLREALSALQEIRRSASMETQPAHAFNLTHIVRRLTCVECERLMGFPDGWTKIPWRIWQESHRKGMSYESLLNEHGMKLREPTTEECPDSPRYKALGNSWATNCAEWVLRRIVAAIRLGMVPYGDDEP